MRHRDHLKELIRESSWLMDALAAVRDSYGAPWVIGAGGVCDLVWNDLHARPQSSPHDVDIAFFDPKDLRKVREQAVESALHRRVDLPREATNQAAVHTWFPEQFGYEVEPLTSIEDAVSSWPETATCVGVCLDESSTPRAPSPILVISAE